MDKFRSWKLYFLLAITVLILFLITYYDQKYRLNSGSDLFVTVSFALSKAIFISVFTGIIFSVIVAWSDFFNITKSAMHEILREKEYLNTLSESEKKNLAIRLIGDNNTEVFMELKNQIVTKLMTSMEAPYKTDFHCVIDIGVNNDKINIERKTTYWQHAGPCGLDRFRFGSIQSPVCGGKTHVIEFYVEGERIPRKQFENSDIIFSTEGSEEDTADHGYFVFPLDDDFKNHDKIKVVISTTEIIEDDWALPGVSQSSIINGFSLDVKLHHDSLEFKDFDQYGPLSSGPLELKGQNKINLFANGWLWDSIGAVFLIARKKQ